MPPASPARIDVHHHLLPAAWIAEAHDHKPGRGWPAHITSWTPQRSIENMDRYGIATALTSIGLPGVWWGDVEAARRLARFCNEYAAQMARDYPGRFGFFATLPMPDIDGSLAEIAYALDVLGAAGIGFLTSYGTGTETQWPGNPAFVPVWEELDRRRAVAYFHPTVPGCCANLMPDVPVAAVEYVFDTTRAITNLLYTGTLTRFQEIRYLFSHAGGAVPMLAGRIAHVGGESDARAARFPQGAEFELKRLRFELATSVSTPALAAVRAFLPVEQIFLGTDYPYVTMDATIDGFERAGLSERDVRRIERENALALFPGFGS